VSWAIWITGRPGSGKTTIAQQVVACLRARGERVALLEASAIAAALVPERAPSAHELDLIHRAVVQAAAALVRAGVPVIIDATAPRRAWRDLARQTIAPFAEVQLTCPDAICGAREQAVRWRRVFTISQGTAAPADPDVVLDYEHSFRAELTVDTQIQPVSSAVADVLLLVERLRRDAQRPAPPEESSHGQAVS
jgi:adenylylsulfate kinase